MKGSLGELSERYPFSLDKPFDVFSCPGISRLSLLPERFSLMPNDLEVTIVCRAVDCEQAGSGKLPVRRAGGGNRHRDLDGHDLQSAKELYHMCIEALKDFDGKVVMSVGKSTDPRDLGSIPDHLS
ncbi:hypothetical protein PO124_26010 [Bacillus licheniformis]|nr:hypothetical protein [Bacillus licheniformis]